METGPNTIPPGLAFTHQSSVTPQQQYAHITGQGSSRIHAGNVYVGEQHNYYGSTDEHRKERMRPLIDFKEMLAFTEMDMRSAKIETAQAQTCEWLPTTPEYKKWLDPELRSAHHGILWIKGKPGAGKSTIMKYTLSCAHKSPDSGKVISFFFNARGDSLEKSIEGMYRSLLYQMSNDVPTLEGMSEQRARRHYNKQGWPLQLLKDMFLEAVTCITRDNTLVCFIDALDECDEDEIRDMLVLFEDLGKGRTADIFGFSVCLASRHYPKITIEHCQEFVLDSFRGHKEDISRYVQRRLMLKHAASKEKLAREVEQRSSGVFLWVVLVVRMLNKTNDGGEMHLIQDRLQRIPTGLHDLFETILNTGERNQSLLPMIQWCLFSERPLEAAELYFAVMSSIGQLSAAVALWDKGLVSPSMIGDFIITGSKGFIHVTGDGDVNRLSHEFIHESVREYFLDHGLRKLDCTLGHDVVAASHDRLARHCITYILFVRIKVMATPAEETPFAALTGRSYKAVPFLNYVRQVGAFYHAEMAEHGGIRQSDFCTKFPLLKWKSLDKIGPGMLRPRAKPPFYDQHHYPISLLQVSFTLLHVLVDLEFEHLVESLLQVHATMGSLAGERYIDTPCGNIGTALHIAITHINTRIVRILLAGGADIEAPCRYLGTPLGFAILRRKIPFASPCARILLEYGIGNHVWSAQDLGKIFMSVVRVVCVIKVCFSTENAVELINTVAECGLIAGTSFVDLFTALKEAVRHCDPFHDTIKTSLQHPKDPSAHNAPDHALQGRECVPLLRPPVETRLGNLKVLLQNLPTLVILSTEYDQLIQTDCSQQSAVKDLLETEKSQRLLRTSSFQQSDGSFAVR
jgi:hypothetical protein